MRRTRVVLAGIALVVGLATVGCAGTAGPTTRSPAASVPTAAVGTATAIAGAATAAAPGEPGQTTRNGHFRVAYVPEPAPPPVDRLHTWMLRIATPDGSPIEGARVSVDGDMPGHGHGLPTKPEVTRYLGDGAYLVEGMRFQMTGEWYVDVTVEAGGVSDTARITFTL